MHIQETLNRLNRLYYIVLLIYLYKSNNKKKTTNLRKVNENSVEAVQGGHGRGEWRKGQYNYILTKNFKNEKNCYEL